jgi:hypothetical protein
MKLRVLLFFTVAALGTTVRVNATEPLKPAASLNDFVLEVDALLLLHKFNFTTSQLEALRELVPAPLEASVRKEGRAGVRFQKTLASLRLALLRNPDDVERISDLEDALADLRSGKDVDLDDVVAITDSARQRAPELFRTLAAKQVASYVSDLADALPDPLDSLLETLDKANALNDSEWQVLADETAREIGWLLGGLDPEKARAFRDQAEQCLRQARAARGKDFAGQRPALEKAARKLVSQVLPTRVLQHVAEYALAELLSNPRLGAALDARLRK